MIKKRLFSKSKVDAKSNGERYFVRLNFNERVQHMIFLICFIVLAITGFMLKLPEDIVQKFGSYSDIVFYYRGILHRIAGTIMILVSLYHVFYLLFTQAGRRWLMDMLPKFKDLTDMIGTMLYYLRVKKKHPEYDRFYYKQKLEYGALIAGATLMSITGLLLWTEEMWPKFLLDIATIVHGMEAILACLAIMVWHMYEVHLRPRKFPIDNLWLTGVIEEEEMREEFPLHYKKIMDDPELQKVYLVPEHEEKDASLRA
ncbi:MAG: cytochrome b/b6 domain-containing protein [Deltaproteobacteria bacterium]|nr:MAG: cytochrome b/b6 domain-containing protein [Deltaproteobacteria bacterium]